MKLTINKTISRTLMAAALVVGTSCDLLELEPQTAFSDATAYSTPERVELAVAGMYDAAQSGFYAGGAVRGYPFGAAHVEQGDCRGEDVVNTQAFYAITYGTSYDPTTANNDFHFQTLYALINRCNVTLAGLETAVLTPTFTQAMVDSYKGEATFLRALAYHELLKHFSRPYSDNPNAAGGGVPIRLTPVTGASAANEAVTQGRNTVQEVYTQILADLNYSESVLPETRSTVSVRISRATKAAAVALKTRIYQHMGNWAAVITEANKLVAQNVAPFTPTAGFGAAVYSLPSNPYAAFSSGGSKNNSESIFSIENSDVDNGSVNGALPSMYSTSVAPTSGRALVAISPIIYNQPWWLSTDTRKGATFISTGELPTGGGKGGYFTRKYTDVTARSDNAPVIRYAEVLLNLAEAIARTSGLDARAHALYYAVRGRANAAGTDAANDQLSDFATANALIQAILNERRIEFLCEGLRWGDIHRLAQDATFNTWGGGIPLKVSQNMTNYKPFYTGDPNTTTTLLATAGNRHDAVPYSNFRFLWPIPNSEIVLNPTLAAQQNPGY
jgi:starch-binding outer membrane protein, SusD/RagB family